MPAATSRWGPLGELPDLATDQLELPSAYIQLGGATLQGQSARTAV